MKKETAEKEDMRKHYEDEHSYLELLNMYQVKHYLNYMVLLILKIFN